MPKTKVKKLEPPINEKPVQMVRFASREDFEDMKHAAWYLKMSQQEFCELAIKQKVTDVDRLENQKKGKK